MVLAHSYGPVHYLQHSLCSVSLPHRSVHVSPPEALPSKLTVVARIHFRAPNIGALLSCRFICGFFAAAPLTLAGGAISDVWDTNERGFAIALFAAAPYGGPVLGPIVGGFIGQTIGWRWILWVNMIFAGVVTLSLLTIPETFAPVILKKRAKRIRQETGDMTYVTEQEAFRRDLSGIIVETLIRPFQMLVEEPILLLMSLYIALIYGLVGLDLSSVFRS